MNENHVRQVFEIMITKRKGQIEEHTETLGKLRSKYPTQTYAALTEHIFTIIEGLEQEISTLEEARRFINGDGL